MRSPTAGVVVMICVMTASAASAAAPQRTDVASGFSRTSVRILDVPYTPQSESLCGGAAAAMVLRYWGERGVYAEDFASLIDRTTSGIRTDVLTNALKSRGWNVYPLRASADDLRKHVESGRPVLVLLEDRPGRYHYVVIVGADERRLIAHDPARAPFRFYDNDRFERAWAAAGHWALLVLPREGPRLKPGTTVESSVAPAFRPGPDEAPSHRTTDLCTAMVQEAVRLAKDEGASDLPRAENLLTDAIRACPHDAAPLTELGGIRFLQSNWTEAASLAARAVAMDPGNTLAWELLATSRYLADDREGALRAWNHQSRPRIDLTRIDGLQRTRYAVVARLADLAPRQILTAPALRRAARRVALLPAATASRVTYETTSLGEAQVAISVDERPLLPATPAALLMTGVRGAIEREATLRIASPSGGGELFQASWRWWDNRPRAGGSVAAPQFFGIAGLWSLDGFWESQAYDAARTTAGTARAEERRRVALEFSDWIFPDVRVRAHGGLDAWRGRGRHLSAGTGVEWRSPSDRVALAADLVAWLPVTDETPLSDARAFIASQVYATARTGRALTGWRSELRAGWARAGTDAPLDLWPGAGTGQGRPLLLRAHPLLRKGVIAGRAFAPSLIHGGAETQYWWQPRSFRVPVRWALALFTDAARPSHLPGGTAKPWETKRWEIDAGTGVRVALPGQTGGLRVDVARGLRDHRHALSVAWDVPWPSRH